MSDPTAGTPGAVRPALSPEEWAGVVAGTVGIVGTPNPAANHQVAAVALHGQPFGFTREDVNRLRQMGWALGEGDYQGIPIAWFGKLADRIAALLPPEAE